MATSYSQVNYIKVLQALQLVCDKAIPSIDKVINAWHSSQTQSNSNTQPCSQPEVCSTIKGKPKPNASSCAGCYEWGRALERVYYPKPPFITWRNINSSLLHGSATEVCSGFALTLPPGRRPTQISDYDTASIIKIMLGFGEYHHNNQATQHYPDPYQTIRKVSEIGTKLTHLPVQSNMAMDYETVHRYFQDMKNFIHCLEELQHFTQEEGNDIIAHLDRIATGQTETSYQSTNHLKYSDMITHNPPIGSGKFGTVFRITFKQRVYKGHTIAAAKILRIMNAKEIHILKTAQHPHIVSFIDYVQEGMISVIVTELADESLRARLNRNRGDVSEALQEKWIMECASAIKYLHDGLPDADGTSKPVVHRDIKADNCLLFAGDLVKLCDFGIAEETDHTTGTSSRKGTEAWMAPELLMSSKFSTASDIYAFGVLIWEITTQEMPTAHQDVRGARIWGQPIRYTFPIYMEDLLPLCWKIDRHDRPTIDGVIARLPKESASAISSNNDTGSSASTESEIDLK
ncbi:uncharacterized protein [Amphiura filiformis]|uniref:uncharacterized protein n=1 Tax=Amphiura filiformis TaxID=82378 RepID=UPI003B20E2DB